MWMYSIDWQSLFEKIGVMQTNKETRQLIIYYIRLNHVIRFSLYKRGHVCKANSGILSVGKKFTQTHAIVSN